MAISVLNEEKIFKLDAGSSSYVMAVMGGGRLDPSILRRAHLRTAGEIPGPRARRGVLHAIPAGEADEFSTDVMPWNIPARARRTFAPAIASGG